MSSRSSPQVQRSEQEEAATKPLVQRQDEEAATKPSIQREEEEASTKPLIQREEEEASAKPLIQREEEEASAKPLVQREEEEASTKPLIQREEEEASTKPLIQREEEEASAKPLVQREEEEASAKPLIQREEEEASAKPLVQREEEEASTKPLIQRAEEEEAAGKGSSGGYATSAFQSRLQSTKGGGEPLPSGIRAFMESRMGSDFGGVRIHRGGEAVQMNRDIGAQAFAHKGDIYFNEGRFDTDSSRGRHLLAHELTHTVQQGASPALKRKSESHGSGASIQRQESGSEEMTDFAAELAESESDAEKAIDPMPAAKAREEAEHEGAEGREEAEAEVLEAEAEATPDAGAEGEAPADEAGAGGATRGVAAPPSVVVPPPKREKGVVGQDLDAQSAGVCGRAAAKSGALAQNEKTHDPAEAKLEQTESAVVTPAEENQSASNAEQVGSVDEAPAPQPDKEQAKATLGDAIEESVPAKIDQLNEFESKGKGKVVGAAVLGQVKKDTEAVQGTYGEMEQTPAPKEPEAVPTELPPVETAPETEALNLGAGAVPELKEEHTDVQEFDQKSDDLLSQEGISDEQLEMVDEGDLAEAKQERKGLKKSVAEEPAAIQEFAVAERQKVDKDLQNEEKSARNAMRSRRDQDLAGAQGRQKKAKSELELKREAVARKINAIYERAKTSVTKKLSNLEKDSLASFDRGQARASTDFEREVKRDVSRWKKKRYSGWFGGAKWLKDKIFGIDHFPEVKQAFDRARARYVQRIDQLILDITAENNRVIDECKAELAAAKQEIKVFVDGLGPELKSAGQAAFDDMKKKLAEMDKFIDRKKEELAKKLCDKKDEAIKKIDEKIEKMKEAMSGALSKLGNLLLGAMIKFFTWALKKAGLDSKALMGVINKGKTVIKTIVKDPIKFLGNVIKAVKNGIGLFVTNIKKHLIGGLISWLTGAMADVPIQLPEKWNLKGILHLVLQILGLTWDRIRKKLVKRVGEKVVAVAEKSVDIIKRLVVEGPIALWEMIKEKAAEIKQQVMEGIRNWVIVNVVKQAVIKLVSFLNPAGAIVQAIIAIYNVIMFFVENIQRIIEFVKSVLESVGDIAMGKLSAAAAAIERAMAMTIPIILAFLARLLGLSGIGKAVTKIIKKIRKPVDKVVDKVIKTVATKAKKLFAKAKKGAAGAKEKIFSWWKEKATFKGARGETHKVYFKGSGPRAKLVVASDEPAGLSEVIAKRKRSRSASAAQKSQLSKASDEKDNLDDTIATKTKNLPKGGTSTQDLKLKIGKHLKKIKAHLVKAGVYQGDEEELPLTKVTHKMQGGKAHTVEANPLTKLAGNTAGKNVTSGGPSPLGWDYVQKTQKSGKKVAWGRTHLLSHRLHGPAERWNLVPTTISVNAGMRKIEHEVDSAIKDGEIWSYKTTVTYKKSAAIGSQGDEAHYPSKLVVTRGKKGSSKKSITASGTYALPGKVDKKALFAGLKSRVENHVKGQHKINVIPTWGSVNNNLHINQREQWLSDSQKTTIQKFIATLNKQHTG